MQIIERNTHVIIDSHTMNGFESEGEGNRMPLKASKAMQLQKIAVSVLLRRFMSMRGSREGESGSPDPLRFSKLRF